MAFKIHKLENNNVKVTDTQSGKSRYYDPQASLDYTQGGKAVGVFYSGRVEVDLYPRTVQSLQVGTDPEEAFSGNALDLMDKLGTLFFYPKPNGGGGLDTNIYNSDGALTANRTLTAAGKNLNFSDLNEFRQSIRSLLEVVTQNPLNTDFSSSIISDSNSVTLKGINDDEVTEGRLRAAEDSTELNWQGFSKIVNLSATNSRLFAQYLDSFLNRVSSLELDGRNANLKAQTGTGVNTITAQLKMDALNESISLDLLSPSGTAGISIKKLGTGGLGINFSGVPQFDNDAAAGLGGLSQGDLYETTGLGLAPLNIAGLILRKQ